MHFSTEQAVEVKAWMVKKLENISDADPEILSDYSIAILQSDDSDEEIRKSAIENLEDFLKEHTVKFVDEIFAKYAPKPVLPTIIPSAEAAVTNDVKQENDGFPIQSYASVHGSNQRLLEKAMTGRKRSYNDAYGQGQEAAHYGNGIASKSFRSKKGPKDARVTARGVPPQQLPPPVTIPSYPFINVPPPPTPPPGFPAFDATNPMAAFAFMQNMFPPMPGMLPLSPMGEKRNGGDRTRCQDYDTKGYCTLGSSCPYEHGSDIIIASADDEYDPTRANFSMTTSTGRPEGRVPRAGSSRMQRNRRTSGSTGHLDAKRNNRAAFSDHRPPPDKNFTTVVVEQIPEEYFDEEIVHQYFSQHGKVVEVIMKPYKRLALVKFETHGSAKRAWETPKAIFENRFVKVYWYRPDLESKNLATSSVIWAKASRGPPDAAMAEGDFELQQEEKQKAYEERMKTKKAMEDARQDLVRRRENMAKERDALVTKLAIAEGPDHGQANSNGTKGAQNGDSTDTPADPKIKALRDQLARMQAEAKSLGIDPEAPSSASDHPHGFRGRGGSFRGGRRGGFAERSSYRGRGAARGRYSSHHFVRGRDPSVKKLDNRPKNIIITGVEFDSAQEENLRSYLTLIGPFEDIELNPQRTDSRIIVFKERWQAEQVMHGTSEIPGVGKVELSWVAAARTAGNRSSVPQPESNNHDDMDLGSVSSDEGRRKAFGDGADRHHHHRHHQAGDEDEDENLDVAGGDDDDWGNIT